MQRSSELCNSLGIYCQSEETLNRKAAALALGNFHEFEQLYTVIFGNWNTRFDVYFPLFCLSPRDVLQYFGMGERLGFTSKGVLHLINLIATYACW